MALKLSGQFRLAPPVCVKIGEGPDLGIDRIEAFVGRHRSVGATHGNLEELGNLGVAQRYTYRVLQTIQMKLILLCVWAEPAVLGSTKTALKFKYEI